MVVSQRNNLARRQKHSSFDAKNNENVKNPFARNQTQSRDKETWTETNSTQ